MKTNAVLSSGFVSEGHPDKVADQIADAVVDAYLKVDPFAQVACETMIAPGSVVLTGDVASVVPVLDEQLAVLVRAVIRDAGYGETAGGMAAQSMDFQNCLCWQPRKEESKINDEAAADPCQQAIVFGYATAETREKMPLPILLARELMHRHAMARISGALTWLGPSAKAQVAVRYENGLPAKVETVVLSIQCTDEVRQASMNEAVIETIIKPVVSEQWRAGNIEYFVVSPGDRGDGICRLRPGMSGRSVVSDTYGGSCPQGSGFLAGKDPGRLDRCAAYAARHVAKNFVAAGLARRCTVQLAYAPGRPRPVLVDIDFHGTGNVSEDMTLTVATRVFDLSPAGIIARLQLRRPIFRRTSVYGCFGRDEDVFTWERTDQTEILRDLVAVAVSSRDCPSIFVAF